MSRATLREKVADTVRIFQNRPTSGEELSRQVLRVMVGRGRFLRDVTTYNPDVLLRNKGPDIIDKMLRDDAVKAAISLKQHAPASTGWRVEPVSDDNRDMLIADFVVANFHRLRGTVEAVFEDVTDALGYGFSVGEMVFARQEGGPWSGKWMLERIVPQSPHNLDFIIDPGDDEQVPDAITHIRQTSTGERIPIWKSLYYVWNGRYGNPWGQTDLDAAYRSWFSKDWAIRHWNIHLERHALERVWAKYDAKNKDLAEQFVDDWAKTVGFASPNGLEVEILGGEKAESISKTYRDTCDFHDQAIARSILKQTLAQSEGRRVGSLAMARVHQDTFILETSKLKGDLEETVIGEQVIRLLVDLNFGPQEQYPSFLLGELFPDDPKEFIDAYMGLVEKGGIMVTKADEDRIRELAKLPAREGEDPPPGNLPSPTLPGVPFAHFSWDAEAGSGEQDGHGDHRATVRVLDPSFRHEIDTFRALRPHEKRVDFAKVETRLDTVEESALAQTMSIVERIREKVLDDVDRKFFRDGLASAKKVNDIHIPYLGEMKRTFDGQGIAVFNGGIEDLRASVARAESFSAFMKGKDPWVIHYAAANPGGLSYDQQLKAFRARWLARAEAVATEFGAEVEKDVRNVLLKALENGETQRETERKLIAVFDKWLDVSNRPGNAVSPWRLENIIRTNFTGAYAQGRLLASRDPDLAGFILAYDYSAVLDERTTEICETLDGLGMLAFDDPMVDRIVPPNHYQCRGLMVEVVQGESVDLAADSSIGSAVGTVPEGFR